MRIAARLVTATASLLFNSILAANAADFKVLISADMEGIAGVTSMVQASPDGREYERSRAALTAEVNAAVFLGYHEKEGTAKAVLAHTFKRRFAQPSGVVWPIAPRTDRSSRRFTEYVRDSAQ